MKLSKKESKYRIKLFQEFHLKKDEQMRIDKHSLSGKYGTYKDIYTLYAWFKMWQVRSPKRYETLFGLLGEADDFWIRKFHNMPYYGYGIAPCFSIA